MIKDQAYGKHVKLPNRPFICSYMKLDCFGCLSSLFFAYTDLPHTQGRLSVQKGGLAPIDWSKFRKYENYKIFSPDSKTTTFITPNNLVHSEMTSMYKLDIGVPVSQKIMPTKTMTLSFSRNVLHKATIPLCFSVRQTDRQRVGRPKLTYQSDKSNDFVLSKTEPKDKLHKIECDRQGYHVIYKTYSDKHRFCDVCRAPFTIDKLNQTLRIRQITSKYQE